MRKAALHMIIGGKGACKSMLGTKLAWQAIAKTTHTVITNLPVKWSGAEQFLSERHGWTGNLRSRLWLLPDDDLDEFYRHRGHGWQIPKVTKQDWNLGERLDFRFVYRYRPTLADVSARQPLEELRKSEIQALVKDGILEKRALTTLPPVEYIIDEVQNVFPSREWQKQGPQLLYYLSQQRHFGDTLYCLSQGPNLMDKQIQTLADDWLYLTNWGNKQKSFFRLPKIVTWGKFAHIAGPLDKPEVSGTFRVDVAGLGSTYDTSAGVGIEGGLTADKNAKTPGAPWIIGVAVLAGALFLAIGSPKLIRSIMHKAAPNLPKHSGPAQPTTANPFPNPDWAPPATRPAPHETKSQQPRSQSNNPQKTLTGIAAFGPTATAFFSDGTKITSADASWRGIIREAEGRIAGVRTQDGEFRLH